MNPDIKNLSKLIALCRKTGVSELETEGIKLKLSPSHPKPTTKKTPSAPDRESPELSEDELLFWSSQGIN